MTFMQRLSDFSATVIEKESMAPGIWTIKLKPEKLRLRILPGQFFMIRAWSSKDPFLFRPFAVSGKNPDGSVDISFKVVGRGTELLTECERGQKVLMRGPCGNGFPNPLGKRLVLAGGAMGIAPLLFARHYYESSIRTLLLLGITGEPEWEPFSKAILQKFPDTLLFSENGMIGRKGTIVDGLAEILDENDEIWACGPEGMFHAMGKIEERWTLPIWVSLERRMACGYGGCLGCAVQTREGPKRVCADGPVFRLKEILRDEP